MLCLNMFEQHLKLTAAQLLLKSKKDIILKFVKENMRPRGLPYDSLPTERRARLLQFFLESLGK